MLVWVVFVFIVLVVSDSCRIHVYERFSVISEEYFRFLVFLEHVLADEVELTCHSTHADDKHQGEGSQVLEHELNSLYEGSCEVKYSEEVEVLDEHDTDCNRLDSPDFLDVLEGVFQN